MHVAKSRVTVTGDNYLEILCDVVAPQLRAKANFDELYFQQDGAPPHYAWTVREYLHQAFPQGWFGRWAALIGHHVHLTPMDVFLWVWPRSRLVREIPTQLMNWKITFQMYSLKLMEIGICVILCVKVFWTNMKIVARLKVNILSTSEIKYSTQNVYVWTFHINQIEVERVNQEKRLVEFAGYIPLEDNQQWGVWCCLAFVTVF